MNWDQIAGNWKQLKGEVKQRWADLTDDDMTFVEGSKDKLIGRLQERRGITREQAQQEIDEWVS